MKFVFYFAEGSEPKYDLTDKKISRNEAIKLCKESNAPENAFELLTDMGLILPVNGGIIWTEEA
jgi:hypothetical protein